MYSSTEMQRKLSKVSPFVVSSSNLNVKTSFMKVIFHVNINLVPHTRRAQVLNFQLQNLNVKTSFMKVIFHVNINLVPHTRRAQVLNFQLQ
jgi:hypothetical protein